jgi:hypothetical protein
MRARTADGGARVRLARILVLMLVGSGLAFAATRFSSPPPTLRQADPEPARAPAPPAPDDAGGAYAAASGDAEPSDAGAGGADVAPVRELTAEEIEAEIAAAEAAMSGKPPADGRNPAAERPLSADLPVALPSDI